MALKWIARIETDITIKHVRILIPTCFFLELLMARKLVFTKLINHEEVSFLFKRLCFRHLLLYKGACRRSRPIAKLNLGNKNRLSFESKFFYLWLGHFFWMLAWSRPGREEALQPASRLYYWLFPFLYCFAPGEAIKPLQTCWGLLYFLDGSIAPIASIAIGINAFLDVCRPVCQISNKEILAD